MQSRLYWGDQLNWTPIVWLGAVAGLLFASRVLTVWFFSRRLREKLGDSPDGADEATMAKAKALYSDPMPIVPVAISKLYFVCGLIFIGTAIWGTVISAWWVFIMSVLIWCVVHWPFRELMRSWAKFQNTWLMKRDMDILMNGGLSPDEEKAIKKRWGL